MFFFEYLTLFFSCFNIFVILKLFLFTYFVVCLKFAIPTFTKFFKYCNNSLSPLNKKQTLKSWTAIRLFKCQCVEFSVQCKIRAVSHFLWPKNVILNLFTKFYECLMEIILFVCD